MSVPAASGVILRMFCALGFPEAARPMNVISAALDQTARIGLVILAVHTFITRARDDMEKVFDNAIGDKHLAMLVERNAPWIGGPVRNHFENFACRLKARNARIGRRKIGVGGAWPSD